MTYNNINDSYVMNNKIKELESKLYSLKFNCFNEDNLLECNKLERLIDRLKDSYSLSTSSIVVETDDIDIYEGVDKERRGGMKYYITGHNKENIMGIIYINYSKLVPSTGNIGYEVKEEYRGRKLILQALNLLVDIIKSNGLEEGIICVKTDNIASIKTALSFGASLCYEALFEGGINRYSINLKEKSNNNLKRKVMC